MTFLLNVRMLPHCETGGRGGGGIREAVQNMKMCRNWKLTERGASVRAALINNHTVG